MFHLPEFWRRGCRGALSISTLAVTTLSWLPLSMETIVSRLSRI